jgi:hypothetical protein
MIITICILVYLFIGILVSLFVIGFPTSIGMLGSFIVHSIFWVFVYIPWGDLIEAIADIVDIFD